MKLHTSLLTCLSSCVCSNHFSECTQTRADVKLAYTGSFKRKCSQLAFFFLHYILIRGLFNKATELWSPHLAEFEETRRKRLDREAGWCLCWGETQWECACRRSPAAPSVPLAVADQKQMSTVIWGSSTGSSSLLHHCGVESRTHLFLAIY